MLGLVVQLELEFYTLDFKYRSSRINIRLFGLKMSSHSHANWMEVEWAIVVQ